MNCSLTVDCILTPSFKYLRAQGSPSSKCCDYKGLTGNLCKVLVFCKMKCACEMEKKKKEKIIFVSCATICCSGGSTVKWWQFLFYWMRICVDFHYLRASLDKQRYLHYHIKLCSPVTWNIHGYRVTWDCSLLENKISENQFNPSAYFNGFSPWRAWGNSLVKR